MKNLTGLQIFAQVAKSLSFASAAEFIGISPSAVSKSISRLEQEMGVKLFHRTTRRVSLTVDGERLAERVGAISDLLLELEDEFSHRRTDLVGRLRLSVSSTLGRRVLVGPLASFVQAHPRLQAEMRCDDKIVDLVEQGIDVAIRTGRLRDSSSLVVTRFFNYQTIVCAAPGLEVNSLEELAEAPKIRFQIRANGGLAPWRLRRDGELVLIGGGGKLVLEDLGAVCRAATAGAGVAMLPAWACLEELQAGRLVELVPDHRPPITPVWLAYLDRRHVSARIRAFVEDMKAKGESLTALYTFQGQKAPDRPAREDPPRVVGGL